MGDPPHSDGLGDTGRAMPDDLDDHRRPTGFTWRRRKTGEVEILHHGRLAATLRADAAADFLAEALESDEAALQDTMARLTGNYKHGNERLASQHPRNRR